MELGNMHGEGQDVNVAAKVNPAAVHMPEDPMTPIVLTGLGTGLAPIRAIVQQRQTVMRSGTPVGPMALIFGGRHEAQDFLYKDEIQEWIEEGLLTDLICAWSRDQEEKVYVQHRIEQNPDLISKYLVDGDGYFYLCGPAGSMPPAVRASVVNSINEGSGMGHEKADELVTYMQINGRYNVEAW
jgi:sulfite reductase alpha subunit-like flavoprotein